MPELTVFLAPDTGAAGILDVLADLSGAGMIRPFHWLSTADVAGGYHAIEVAAGRRAPVAMQETIVVRRVQRVRLCVLVPLFATPEPVPSGVEQDVLGLLSANAGGAPVTPMRCLLGRGGEHLPSLDDVARTGWHNLFVAPEREVGPATGRWVLPWDAPLGDADALSAPAVAGITGLWAGAGGCALDGLDVPAGKAVRAARAFYRRVEAGEVENELRARVLTTRPQLPLPRQYSGPPTVYLSDPGAACETMARHLWRKHRIDRGQDYALPVPPTSPLGTGTLLRWLPRFLLAAARSNPQRWYGALLGWVRATVPHQEQARAVSTLPPSHAELVRGTRADGQPLSWDELGRIADEVDGFLPPLPGGPPAPDPGPDPARLWQDFAGGAFTLADAGDRGGPEMPPAQAGAGRGVVERVQSCVPGPETDFPVRAANVAARTGIHRVQAGDVLGADALRRRLASLETDLSLADGRSVAEVRGALGEWEAGQTATYSYQAALPIAIRLHHVGAELRALTADLVAAARPPELTLVERDYQLRLGVGLFGVAVTGTLVLLITVLVMLIGPGPVLGALITAGAALLVAVGGPALGYRIGLRRTFRALRGYRELTARVEADQLRLRRALREYRRLRDTYADYLSWSRAVAVVLADPFGRADDGPAAGGPVALHGLPPSVRVGQASTDPDALPAAAAMLRAEFFDVGWLGTPWQSNLDIAVRRLTHAPLPEARAEQVLGSRAHPGGDPPLRAWSGQLVADGPDRSTGAAVWAGVLRNLDRHQLGDGLPLRIRGDDASLPDFLVGIDSAEYAGHRFDAAHFTPPAQIEDRARVVFARRFGSSSGLSRVHVLVQLSDAFPPYDLELGPGVQPDDGPVGPDSDSVF